MTININDGERYVPQLFGNDKEPEPLAFNLQYLTVKDQDEMEYYEVVSVGKGNRVKGKINFIDTFQRGVVSIENCVINGKPITTAAEYLAIRGSKNLTLIMQDVAQHLHEATELDVKN